MGCPLYGVSAIERCPLSRGLTALVYFRFLYVFYHRGRSQLTPTMKGASQVAKVEGVWVLAKVDFRMKNQFCKITSMHGSMFKFLYKMVSILIFSVIEIQQ